MILEGHGKEWEFSEKPAIEQLVKMGYVYKTNKEINSERDEYSEPLLLDRVKEAIKRINVDDDIGNSVEINGISLKDELVEPRIVDNVSEISKQECIRLALVSQQRSLASTIDIVMVGRDIGTIVLPDADLKIYITASLSIRARRRWLELKDKGVKVNYSQIVDSIKKRDLIDSNRTNSPLAIAQDAWEINTDNLGVKQVTELIIQKLRNTTPNIPIIEPI